MFRMCWVLLFHAGNCPPLICMLGVIGITFLDFVRYSWYSYIATEKQRQEGLAGNKVSSAIPELIQRLLVETRVRRI